MQIANKPFNDKYIGHKCIICLKQINEEERQRIISLDCVQTWCLLCIDKKYPEDKWLHRYVSKGDQTILARNKLINEL